MAGHLSVHRLERRIERLGYPVAYLNPDSKGIIDRFGPNVETYACDQQNFRVIAEIAVGKIFFNWIFGFDGKVKMAVRTVIYMLLVQFVFV